MNARTGTTDQEWPAGLSKVSVVHLDDPTAVGNLVDELDQDVVNLGDVDFEGKQVSVPLIDCCLLYQWTNTRLRTRTRVHDKFDACTIVGPNGCGNMDGAEIRPYAMLVGGPGAQGEIIVDGGFESIGLLVPPKALERHLSLRGLTHDFAIPKGAEVRYPNGAAAREVFELGKSIADTAESNPDIFNTSRGAREGAQVEFIEAFLAAIESLDQEEQLEPSKTAQNHSQVVTACEDYTLGLDSRRPYLSELCETAKVSARTLQNAFRDTLGMKPMAYLARLRLHRARDELQNARSGSTTVTEVALNWGFWHFSAFSRGYKNCFGESPSETLRRSAEN